MLVVKRRSRNLAHFRSCPSIGTVFWRRLAKRSWALLGSNPTRNSQADGAPKARGPAGFPAGPCFRTPESCLRKSSLEGVGVSLRVRRPSGISRIKRSPACHRNRDRRRGTRPAAPRCAACYPYMAHAVHGEGPVHNGLFVTSQAGSRKPNLRIERSKASHGAERARYTVDHHAISVVGWLLSHHP